MTFETIQTTNHATKNLSVIIPTLREFENLQILIPILIEHLKKINLISEVIIVDDESESRTRDLIDSLQGEPKFKLLSAKHRRGLAESALQGFKTAEGEIVLLMDGDLSHNPSDIKQIITPILNNESDISVGSRYIKNSKITGWTLPRIILSKTCALLLKPICGLSDPGSGFFAFKKSSIDLNKIRPLSWKIGLEIFCQNKNSITEIPINFKNRSAGQTKLDLKVGLNFISHITRLYRENRKKL